MTSITIKRPDDWHLHLRDGEMLEGVIEYSAKDFARAIIMPNLVPPVVTTQDATAYRERIMKALPKGMNFTPLMTLYLTENTDPADVAAAPRATAYSPTAEHTPTDEAGRLIGPHPLSPFPSRPGRCRSQPASGNMLNQRYVVD